MASPVLQNDQENKVGYIDIIFLLLHHTDKPSFGPPAPLPVELESVAFPFWQQVNVHIVVDGCQLTSCLESFHPAR